MFKRTLAVLAITLASVAVSHAEVRQLNYFGHYVQVDHNGVIAPWYHRQDGQLDFRVRIAAETMKRYPWTPVGKFLPPAPEYIYNGRWDDVDFDGRIVPGVQADWNNGDLGQRNAFVLSSMIDYYRYTGDPAALEIITASADHLVNHCQTPATHGWPRMLISVPDMGALYGDCKLGTSDVLADGQGKIQLDIVAQFATELVRAYEMTGNTAWYDAAKHWADLLVQNRRHDPSQSPWGRYANNASGNGMNGIQTGGVAIILTFFDELIRTGYTGHNNDLIAARDEGRRYMNDILLPRWTQSDTWGHDFWDWEAPVQDRHVTERATVYMLDHKDVFPNWKNDVRNILMLYINHNTASPASKAETFNGAWAYPESSSCCGDSLFYATNAIASVFTRYGVEAKDAFALEVGRRSQILVTYDIAADGRSQDVVAGGADVSRTWFKNAGPKALKDTLRSIEWQPELGAPARENHLVHSAGVVRSIRYGKGHIEYRLFDAPTGDADVLRLSFMPTSITADGKPLALVTSADQPGFTAKKLADGDVIVSIVHPGALAVDIRGNDPQQVVPASQLAADGAWTSSANARSTDARGASVTFHFKGNQLRVIGSGGKDGGLADVYLDDEKQLVPIDAYSPTAFHDQTLYYKTGLTDTEHTLRIAARGSGNPIASGHRIALTEVQYSDAVAPYDFGEGGGPQTQRLIFGYTGRKDFIDSHGNAWRPGADFVARTGRGTDVFAHTWWSVPQAIFITLGPRVARGRTAETDEELYRYGVHWKDFTVNLTAAPGTYHLRLKFAENEFTQPGQRAISIEINGQRVITSLDVLATAGGPNRPADLVFNNIKPVDGIVEVRFLGDSVQGQAHDAMIQAIELAPGDAGAGDTPKTVIGAQAAFDPTRPEGARPTN